MLNLHNLLPLVDASRSKRFRSKSENLKILMYLTLNRWGVTLNTGEPVSCSATTASKMA